MAPKDIQVLILGNCKCNLIDKRDFEDVTMLSVFRWENYPGLSGDAQDFTIEEGEARY